MQRFIEFQAVVLAGGKGSRMTDLTDCKPKCLLPVHNHPMIYYPLRTLQKAGFTEALIIVSDTTRKEITSALNDIGLKIKPEVIAVPNAEDMGTADAIRAVSDKIKHDFIVVSCDLIADFDIGDALNIYRMHNASITALLMPTPEIPSIFITPGPKSKHQPEVDLIGIDDQTSRIVFIASAADFDEAVHLPSKLLRKHSKFTVHSKLTDAHFYIIAKWVRDFLIHNTKFSSLKGELIPYIIKKQSSRPPPPQNVDDKNMSTVGEDNRTDIFKFAVEDPLAELVRKMSGYNDHTGDLEPAYHGDTIRCYGVIMDKIGLRANTVQMYAYANSMEFPINKPSISPKATVKSTQVTNCNIDAGALIDDKTSVKDSNIGAKAVIESKAKVSASVIMSGVRIKQGCVIENSILCNNCVIEEGTELKNCLIGTKYIVAGGGSHSREVLTDVAKLMVIN